MYITYALRGERGEGEETIKMEGDWSELLLVICFKTNRFQQESFNVL